MNAYPSRRPTGGMIDRDRVIPFQFNGRHYKGYPGDTLASALLANGVRVVARSFKYHRPRGIVGAGFEEPNALVQLQGTSEEPNVLATCLPLTDHLHAKSQNCWPGPRFDLGSVNDRISRLIPAGFYYKTFMWRPWNSYARVIRKAAGLGQVPKTTESESYEKRYHHCDILIVGAGPSGLAAALVAGESGARVLFVDDQSQPGGRLLSEPAQIDGQSAVDWAQRITAEVDRRSNVRRLANSTVAGYYDHNMLTVIERNPEQSWLRERFWRVRAQQVIIATGAVERPLVFPNNDRPGMMLVSAASTYVHRFAVNLGRQIVITTNNNSAYQSAFDLVEAGQNIHAIVDTRQTIDYELLKRSADQGIEVLSASGISAVHGRSNVHGVEVVSLIDTSQVRKLACDVVCYSGGWNPLVHLHSHSGAKPVYDPRLACFVPGESVQSSFCAGAVRGVFDLKGCLHEGLAVGRRSVEALGLRPKMPRQPDASDTPELQIEPIWEISTTSRAKAFVDFQNDVTSSDLKLAVRENYASVEHAKRYTTAGMATDQGKISNTNVIGLIAKELSVEPGSVGTTTYRPPYSPISFGAIAGSHNGPLILPLRTTPITQWHIDSGASMNEAGSNFRRPFYYPGPGEDMRSAVNREALAVRENVGIYDGTPLGKFELHGPDVTTFLNRVYTNSWDDLEIGQGRFGLMLHEDGRLLDDGVTFRLGENHYLLSAGSGTADAVYTHMVRLLQVVWPNLRVYVTTVTAQWVNICVCGPKAREVLASTGIDINLDANSFPFMSMREGQVAGKYSRVARVSYTGELSFEVNVRRRDGLAVWEALMDAGAAFGITPVGSETSGVLRIEKGYISAGAEGDGITNPFDAGMSWVVNMKKSDFVGKRSLVRDQSVDGLRQQVVGLLPQDEQFVMVEGSAIIEPKAVGEIPGFLGHVTASCFSPNLDRSISLALLKNGRDRHGDTVTVSGLDRTIEALVVPPVFIDAKGERMRS